MAATQSVPEPPRTVWPGEPGDAARLVAALKLSDEARSTLDPRQRVPEYLESLRQRGLLVDAVSVVAHWLPRRAGVWWACRSVREMLRSPAAKMDPAPLDAAERWVAEPSDALRRAAGAAAEAANYETPAACAALAAFWSEGSLAPPHVPPVTAPPHLAPGAMANAVQLAAVVCEPQKATEKLTRFLDIGLAVAQGKDRWPEPAAVAPPAKNR